MRLDASGSALNAAALGGLDDRCEDGERDDRAAEQQRHSLKQGARGQAAQKACLHTLTVRGASKARCKY